MNATLLRPDIVQVRSEADSMVPQAVIDEHLPEHLSNHIEHVLALLRSYNEKLPDRLQRRVEGLKYLENFFRSFVADRNRRATEVGTPEYQVIAEATAALLPMRTNLVLCMDGRVKAIHTNGLIANVAGAIRTPAGVLNEFIRVDGVLTLDPKSNFGKLLREVSHKYPRSAQVLDSHYGCLARANEEAATGHLPHDHGLLRDVELKTEMVQAITRFLTDQGITGQVQVATIQTSFNPITGYAYMGLETANALNFAREKAGEAAKTVGSGVHRAMQYAEYTKPVLKVLIERGKILSTGGLIAEPQIKSMFDELFFSINRQKNYVEGADEFRKRMGVMKGKILPIMQNKLLVIYPHLAGDTAENKAELEERAMLLVFNAFNTYLLNRDHNEMRYLGMSDEEYEHERHYPYGLHDEAGVKVSEGGHPPYDIPVFVVYGQDLPNLPARVEAASRIVRENRRAGRIKCPPQYRGAEEFASGIIPIVVQEIIREHKSVRVSEEDWKGVEQATWEDMPKEWNTMSNSEFVMYLESKSISNILLIEGIQNLRRKMAALYHHESVASPHLRDLYKATLPILCDEHRRTRSIIPFLKIGREA